ncbi:MAG: dCMP deaminase [Opitutia bacterium]|nr:dCMP deaminase [Opitutales bacterium]PHX68803.1 MAG: dCMP deaminase [Opitutae bacterium]
MEKPISLVSQLEHLVADAQRPSWNEYFMATAFLVSTRSSCDRLHVGCVVVSTGKHPNRLVAAGYNGFLPGAPHDSHVRDGHELATVHAEQNAVADAAKRGISLQGTICFVTHYPCVNCAKILAAAGITEVRYRQDYHNEPLVAELFQQAGVVVTKLEI